MSKILNDPIHGTITLHPLLIKIIDTPQFQRLRNIKQLGGCYFVYPSASHNRFEHSIGTCFLASKLARQLQKRLDEDIEKLEKDEDDEKKMYATKLKKAEMTEDDKLCIEIAGLCHDIGHGPYSHLFDRMFNKAMKEKDPSTVEWKHEEVARKMIVYMIKENDDLKKAFQNKFGADTERKTEFIKDLIDGTKKETEDKARHYMYEIVANKRNEIDVDKMDYFARDCHGLGMKSNFDHLRFISQCRVMFSSDIPEETTIAVRDKEEYNLYELFHTRIGLFRRAYYHKVTKAVELMFTDALVKANDHLLFKNNKGENIKMSKAWEHPEVYEKLTDNVFDAILIKKDPNEDMQKAQELINNVYKRKLYRLVDDTLPVKKIKAEEDRMKQLLLQTGLTEDDFAVQKITFSYGREDNNPITSVYFYKKDKDIECFTGKPSKKTSLFLPSENF
ncbi:deoxynucleoside triphosphate triphosphohydrolase SAMHD1-like isoform X2 [Mytilus californianus]|uniref:deoxynucleoside triphosphate triphosphohydrolase SAMHD1-like isoform X2 n=1 Tax=Mytilus californianus TaxID=6549 RepID=UPI002245B4B9|nr:deoxynucleoside triphosphate triphosphohydrolase SAMHD1-like isoform X2 [Mytilus californianus]